MISRRVQLIGSYQDTYVFKQIRLEIDTLVGQDFSTIPYLQMILLKTKSAVVVASNDGVAAPSAYLVRWSIPRMIYELPCLLHLKGPIKSKPSSCQGLDTSIDFNGARLCKQA